MTERCPAKRAREVRSDRGGSDTVRAVVGISAGGRKAGSKTSPEMKGTGNVFDVDLKSLCPSCQNSANAIRAS